MRARTVVVLLLAALLIVLAACSDKKEEVNSGKSSTDVSKSGFPIVEEPITLAMFAKQSPSTSDNWNGLFIWKEYEKMTNIHVVWEQIPNASLQERRNLALASGSLPDAFFTAEIPTSDILKYGQQGTFIRLNELIDEYAPNLKKILDENPDIRKGITFPDGNIYTLPTIYSPEFLAVRANPFLWINQDWLEKLQMELPETTEEFYQYLKAVQKTDLNGNGKNDEIPYGSPGMDLFVSQLQGSFGLGNKGPQHPFIDADPDHDQLRFFPISDKYKEMLQYIHKLYSEKLIEQSIYSIEWNQYLANDAERLYGSTVYWTTPDTFGPDRSVVTPPLAGPHGDRIYRSAFSAIAKIGNFAITNKNQHPAETIRWADYFYSDEGARFQYMGIEGVTFERTPEGGYKYLDELLDSPEGKYAGVSEYLYWNGQSPPGVVKQEYFGGSEASPESLAATEKIKPYLAEEIWSEFTYTADESRKLMALATDIEKYVNEMQAKFITGEISFTEWDKYLDTLNKMGLDEYMEIKKAAYERYKAN